MDSFLRESRCELDGLKAVHTSKDQSKHSASDIIPGLWSPGT